MRTYLLAALAATALSTAAGADTTRILVIPFNTLNVADAQQWIGKGAQEALIADMARSGDIVPVGFKGAVIVEDNATAARLARQAQASLAIRGTAQVRGNDVRLSAQVLDAKTGELLRTATATGVLSDLLKVQDDLTAQLRGPAQPLALVMSAVSTAPAAAPQVVVVPQPAPPLYYPFPPYPPALYPGYYPYGYSYNSLGWYSGWYPLITTSNGSATGGVIIHTHTGGPTNNTLPIPTNNVLPIPTNNVLPIPTNNVQPIPTNNVLPLPKNNVQPLPKSGASLTPTNKMVPVSKIPAALHKANTAQKP
jgi:TolB-like protein